MEKRPEKTASSLTIYHKIMTEGNCLLKLHLYYYIGIKKIQQKGTIKVAKDGVEASQVTWIITNDLSISSHTLVLNTRQSRLAHLHFQSAIFSPKPLASF